MIYDYRCIQCGTESDNVYNCIAERKTHAPVCCGERMAITIKVAPMGFVSRDIHYVCPVTGEGVTSKRQRKYIMEKNDLIDANDFARTSAQRKADKDKKQSEIQAIKDEVPLELRQEFNHIEKTEKRKFLNNL